MSLSQYILDAKEQYRLQIREHSTILTRARWYYIFILGLVTIVASLLTESNPGRNIRFALFVMSVAYTFNFILWALTKLKNQKITFYQGVAAAQIVLDICLASFTIYYQGGLISRGVILYAIPIIGAGLLFSSFYAYVAGLMSGAAYALTITLYQIKHIEVYELRMIALPAIFYAAVFIILAYLVSAYNSKLRESDREKSYTELLALLRHQMYHPSGVIAAIVDMLEHGENYSKWPTGDKTYLQQIKRENKKLHTMIANSLESISDNREEVKNTEVFDIVPLLNDEAVSCATGARRMIDLKTMLPNTKIEVQGNQGQLTIALDNVIENAFHYTEKGTPVSVAVEEENYKVYVTVEDKGKGMTKEQQKMLFKLFAKLDTRVTGKHQASDELYSMGLGLYVARLIVERHRGSLELESTPKQGTKVTITLYKRLI